MHAHQAGVRAHPRATRVALAVAALSFAFGWPPSARAQTSTGVPGATGVTIQIQDVARRNAATDPLAMGFTMGWGIQWGRSRTSADTNLWMATATPTSPANITNPDLDAFLKAHYPESTYRYFTGDQWGKTVGPVRAPFTNDYGHITDGNGQPIQVRFGLDEFMAFVERVGGKAHLVLSMRRLPGDSYEWNKPPLLNAADSNHPGQLAAMRQDLLGLFEYVLGPACDKRWFACTSADWNGDGTIQGWQRKQNTGRDAPYAVSTWELGNEVDAQGGPDNNPQLPMGFLALSPIPGTNTYATPTTAQYQAAATAYGQFANSLITAVKAKVPNGLTFLAHTQTGEWAMLDRAENSPDTYKPNRFRQGHDVTAWHKAVLAAAPQLTGLSYHGYYDGHAVPTINEFLEGIKAAPTPGKKIYVTEHGRWPWGAEMPENTWGKTTDIEAALANADFIISHAQDPRFAQLLNFDIDVHGPWALLTRVSEATGMYDVPVGSKALTPRPLAYALAVLHKPMNKGSAFASVVTTPISTNYPCRDRCDNDWSPKESGRYDVRATGYKLDSAFGTLAVNRALVDHPLTLSLPGWTAPEQVVKVSSLSGAFQTGVAAHHVAARVSGGATSDLRLQALSVTDVVNVGPNVLGNGSFEAVTGTVPNQWEPRPGTGTSCVAPSVAAPAAHGLGGGKISRLQASSGGGGCALVQPPWYNPALAKGGLLDTAKASEFVVRANIKTSTPANAILKLQFFKSSGVYVATSPTLSAANVATNLMAGSYKVTQEVDGWYALEFKFKPNAWLSTFGTNGYVEVAVINTGNAVVDVDSVTLVKP